MNKITRKALSITALENRAAANRNDSEFRYLASSAHFNLIKSKNEIRLFHRALRLWMVFHPEQFDQGFIMSHETKIFNNLIIISEICKRIMRRRMSWDPEWRFDPWSAEDIPDQSEFNQMKLF